MKQILASSVRAGDSLLVGNSWALVVEVRPYPRKGWIQFIFSNNSLQDPIATPRTEYVVKAESS